MSLVSGSAPTFIHLHTQDSVVVALKELPQGTVIHVGGSEIVVDRPSRRAIKSRSRIYQPSNPFGIRLAHRLDKSVLSPRVSMCIRTI